MSRNPAKAAAIACVVLLALWVVVFATRGFLSGDSGVKFAQAHALESSGFASRAIPYSWSADPRGIYAPYGDLVVHAGGERQGIYSWVFTAATVPFLWAAGVDGLVVLPLLGAILTVIGLYRLMNRCGFRPITTACAIVLSVLLTPLLLYASQYAEHSLATGLLTLAVSFAVDRVDAPHTRRVGVAGALVALAAAVRPEAYCAVAALGLAIAFDRRRSTRERLGICLRYLAGCVPVLLVYWGVNYMTAETWDLAVSRNSGRGASPDGAVTMIYGEIGSVDPRAWLAAIAVPVVVGLGLHPAVRARWHIPVRGVVAVALCALAFRAHQLGSARTLAGLFAVTPLVAYGVLAGPYAPRTRLVWLVAVTFAVLVLMFDRSGTAGGLQLGARFLLPCLPLLMVLAAGLVERDWAVARTVVTRCAAVIPAAGLAVLSMTFAIRGYAEASAIAEDGWAATQTVIEADPTTVITLHWWESQVLSPATMEGKQLYYVESDLRTFLARLAETGVRDALLVSEQPIAIRLRGDLAATTVRTWRRGWATIQQVRIE